MAKNQLKGTKKPNAIVSQEIIDSFNTVLKKILKAWSLIPLQDPDSIGKLHDEVVRICTNVIMNYKKDNVFRLLQYLAKIPYHVEEGLRLNFDNKLEGSFKDYGEANHFCNYTLEEFQKIKDTMYKEFISIFPIFDFLECCRLITSILKEDSSNVLKFKNGKYINQAERFRNLAGHFRKFSTDLVRLDTKNEELNEELNNIRILAKRVADMCKEKAQEIETDNAQTTYIKPKSNKVFIVHGLNRAILLELKEILEKSYGIKPVVLNRVPDRGRTVIEKFEDDAISSGFAFVIMTKDDLVKKERKSYYQGRPNVFFELGWFCGRYGRDRVRILKEEGAEIPSDLKGILTLNFREKLEEVFRGIGEDLKHSGII